MKRVDADRTVFHPILAAYLIKDFVDAAGKARMPEAIESARDVADKALALASPYSHGSLVYWYEPGSGLSEMPRRFYSGLTQAWFVRALSALQTVADGYSEQAASFFNSLAVPLQDGGPLLEHDFGWVVEEYPYDPPLYTLNGWLTMLRLLLEGGESLERLPGFEPFVINNLRAVKRLLPLYDAGFIKNSRYQLTGFTRVRLVLSKAVGATVKSFTMTIPSQTPRQGELNAKAGGRWGNYLERSEGRILQFNVLQSLISFPVENLFSCELDLHGACTITVFVGDGDYDPLSTGMPTKRWRQVAELNVAPGRHEIAVPLPWDDRNLFAYPTNFKKSLKGQGNKTYNSYHFVHIMDLASLYHCTGEEMFKEYALRWSEYVAGWPELPFLPAEKFSHAHFDGDKFFERVESYLTQPVRKLRTLS
ncbi:D-glucuronyl C5-epimerase family protein [Eleftheria terrae]|uniref:D-glucuronyl C5-epimerase family protein n=1 Tax=Eleftheria terrae TaxID=1597781 RepID=UPI00263B283B|nr:D-glucuronyl C5-epimerase family protein [Eleftheria terrae]WKB51083.1 D-glucuronyl C5-epimerase family protein [Eleftheria terrae]